MPTKRGFGKDIPIDSIEAGTGIHVATDIAERKVTISATGGAGGPADQLNANGTILDVDAIIDGEVLKRVGALIVSTPLGTPAAHASTHQNLGSDVINVGGLLGVLANPQPPIIGAGAAQAVAGNDARLTDSRNPLAHAASHNNNGSDELNVAGLSGLLADAQTPLGHTHAQLDITNLISDLADKVPNTRSISTTAPLTGGGDLSGNRTLAISDATTAAKGAVELATDGEAIAGVVVQGNDARLSNARTPTSHAASHNNNGADEISVAGLSGLLADAQTPVTHDILTKHNGFPGGTTNFLREDGTWAAAGGGGNHAATHQNGGGDEISVAGLSGLLADGQTPIAHAANHKSGGSDSIKLDELAAPTDIVTLNASTTAHGLLPKLSNVSTEYLDGTGAFSTPAGGGGGTTKSWIRADVDRTLPNDTNVNPIFNNPTNGRLTLTTGFYKFWGIIIITGMSATSGNALLNMLGAGTATIASWLWSSRGLDNTAPATIGADLAAYYQVAVTAASMVTAGTGTALRLMVEGTFKCTAAGTLIPSIDLVNAAAAVVQDGSYIEFERMGATTDISSGSWT